MLLYGRILRSDTQVNSCYGLRRELRGSGKRKEAGTTNQCVRLRHGSEELLSEEYGGSQTQLMSDTQNGLLPHEDRLLRFPLRSGAWMSTMSQFSPGLVKQIEVMFDICLSFKHHFSMGTILLFGQGEKEIPDGLLLASACLDQMLCAA